jgi:hypothetical protein
MHKAVWFCKSITILDRNHKNRKITIDSTRVAVGLNPVSRHALHCHAGYVTYAHMRLQCIGLFVLFFIKIFCTTGRMYEVLRSQRSPGEEGIKEPLLILEEIV